MHSIPAEIRKVELTIGAVLNCILSTLTTKVHSSVIVIVLTATEVIEWFFNDGSCIRCDNYDAEQQRNLPQFGL